jgi:hypothetical protein
LPGFVLLVLGGRANVSFTIITGARAESSRTVKSCPRLEGTPSASK